MINRHPVGAFGFASANFYTSFLAALHAEKYKKEIFGNDLIQGSQPIQYQVHQTKKRTRARQLVKNLKADEKKLLSLNPELNQAITKNALLPTGFKVYLPL